MLLVVLTMIIGGMLLCGAIVALSEIAARRNFRR